MSLMLNNPEHQTWQHAGQKVGGCLHHLELALTNVNLFRQSVG